MFAYHFKSHLFMEFFTIVCKMFILSIRTCYTCMNHIYMLLNQPFLKF